MSGYKNRPKKQFYNRPNYGYSNAMPQSRPPLPNPPWQVANPWLENKESQLQYYENGNVNFIPRAPEPSNIIFNNKNNLPNETGTVQHQTPINNQQTTNENIKSVPPLFNNAHFASDNIIFPNNNMVSYPIPAKYQDTGCNPEKTSESSNKTTKYSSDNRSASDNRSVPHNRSDNRYSSNNRSKKYKSSHYKHNSHDNTNRSSQDSSYHRRSNSAESNSLPRNTRTHSSSPNRKLLNRSSSNLNRNLSSKGASKKKSSSEAPSRRHGQEKTSSLPPSKPVTAKIPEKLPKKLNKDTILKLVNSTTRYEPAMQKLLREQRSKLTQNLRNKYNNDTNKDSMTTNSIYADEEITDGIIPNFTLNLTEDLQFLQEALDNVDEKEAQDAAKLRIKNDNDCDKSPPDEDKNSADLILLDEWSATDEKDTEELISYNNYDLGPLELPSNIDELQLPSDVSSFFNFTEINKDETTSLINGGGVEEDQDFFNTVKINENTECNESTIDTTKLSPIKTALANVEQLSLSDNLVENKQQINDQNENVISEICKENINDENYSISSFKTDEIVKNNEYLSSLDKNSLESSENVIEENYVEENVENNNLEKYLSPFKNEQKNNQSFENCVKNVENIPNENLYCVSSLKDGDDKILNENHNQVDRKDNIQHPSKQENFVLPLNETEQNENFKSSFPATTETKILSNSSEKEISFVKKNELNVSSKNQTTTQIINKGSKKSRRKSTNEKRVLTKKRNYNKSSKKKTRKEQVKPIRIKLIKEKNSLKKNLNYFRQIIRAEILNTTATNSYKQQKRRKSQSNNINNEQIIENNIKNISNKNYELSERSDILCEKKISEESQNEIVQNIDCSSLIKKVDVVNHDDAVNSEKSKIKQKNLEDTTSNALLENSDLVSTQFTSDNRSVSGEIKNEDDISSDNTADNIRLSVSSNENFVSRKWRSPGEKKFISASSTTNKRPIISSTVSSTNGKEEILLKIYDIDVQIQRLMDDKMNLYKQLMAHSEECQENITTKKSVARKLDLGTELKIDTGGPSKNVVSERIPTNEVVDQQSLDVTNGLLETNSPVINNEKVNNEIDSDAKQTNKRNKHNGSKSKKLNRNIDKENVSKRKYKKIQSENKSKPKKVFYNVEQLKDVEIKKPLKIIEKDDKIESNKSSLIAEKVEGVNIQQLQKSIGKDIEKKKSTKKSRRERLLKKSSSKDKHSKETIRNDETELKKSVSITEQNVTKRSIKASSVAPGSDAEDNPVKSHSNRIGNLENDTHKTKKLKRKRDQRHDPTYSDCNSDDEDKLVKNNFNRNETPDSETRKIKSKRKREQDHDNDSKLSMKKLSNKKSRKKHVVSDSDGESVIELQRPTPPINNLETARMRRCSFDKRQKSVEHELSSVKMKLANSIIKPCIVPLVRINPEKYLKVIEIKQEIESIVLDSTASEDELQEVNVTDIKLEKCVGQLNENSLNVSNEPSPVISSISDQVKVEKIDDGTGSNNSFASIDCSNNSINNNDIDCSSKKLECFKCSNHTGSILFVKTYKNAIIAGGEDGKIYKYNIENGKLLKSVCAHQAAITSFYIRNNKDAVTCIYSGSLDTYFKCFEIETLKELTSIQISTSIQCMDADWGYVFLGTVTGFLYRYSINNNIMEDDTPRIGKEAILVLKTQSEGGRRILIAAPRNELISIRDAMSGLLLRYITFTTSNYTIYSIMLSQHGSIIYCGTNKKVILGYNFADGVLTKELLAGKGIVCLLEYKQILFAGCYDGFIYVFDILTNKLVTKFVGPGGMILALDVFDNKVVMGSKNSCLEVRSMPEVVLKYINENRR